MLQEENMQNTENIKAVYRDENVNFVENLDNIASTSQEMTEMTTSIGGTVDINISSQREIVDTVTISHHEYASEDQKTKTRKKKNVKIFIIAFFSACSCVLCICGCIFILGTVISVILGITSSGDDTFNYRGCHGFTTEYEFCFNMTSFEEDTTSQFHHFTDDVSVQTCEELLHSIVFDSYDESYAFSAFTMTKGENCWFADPQFDNWMERDDLEETHGVNDTYCSSSCPGGDNLYDKCGDSEGKYHSFFRSMEYMCSKLD